MEIEGEEGRLVVRKKGGGSLSGRAWLTSVAEGQRKELEAGQGVS
jgi:hypothetical protein